MGIANIRLNSWVEELSDGFSRLVSGRSLSASQIFIGIIASLALPALALPAAVAIGSWVADEGKKAGWW